MGRLDLSHPVSRLRLGIDKEFSAPHLVLLLVLLHLVGFQLDVTLWAPLLLLVALPLKPSSCTVGVEEMATSWNS